MLIALPVVALLVVLASVGAILGRFAGSKPVFGGSGGPAETTDAVDAAERSLGAAIATHDQSVAELDRLVRAGEDVRAAGGRVVDAGQGLVDDSRSLISEAQRELRGGDRGPQKPAGD